jgi:hypothetical protein
MAPQGHLNGMRPAKHRAFRGVFSSEKSVVGQLAFDSITQSPELQNAINFFALAASRDEQAAVVYEALKNLGVLEISPTR